MNTTQSFDDSAETEHAHDADQRNRYFRHRNLKARDFRLEQAYSIERRRLLNRTVIGWGVVQGFALALQDADQLACGSGLALDRHGRELVRRTRAALTAAEVVRLDDQGLPAPAQPAQYGQPEQYLLQAHYAERRLDPVRTDSACDCGRQEWDHLLETVVFTLLPAKAAEADWRTNMQAACRDCGCATTSTGPAGGPHRDPQACLCQWGDAELGIEEDSGTRIGEVCYSLGDPVPLGLVTVVFDECGPRFSKPEACNTRRIVKTNDVLFDLIRGCDLTRITEHSWSPWHDSEVSWSDFAKFFPPHRDSPEADPDTAGRTTITIAFSRPVTTATLRPACVSLRVLSVEAAGGWLEVKHVPVTGLIAVPDANAATTERAVLAVDARWCDDEIRGRRTVFDEETQVELEIRGDLILDCHDQAIDATSAGPARLPSGNGTPGGCHFISFTLIARGDTTTTPLTAARTLP